jgi:hypothetical protein
MIMWYPIDGSDFPDGPTGEGSNVAVAIKPEDAPKADELASWVQSEKDLTKQETLSLGFAPFKLDEAANQRTIVLDVTRYADKGNVRWGVGLRLTLHAWASQGTIQGSVALVAAQASLNLVYTRASFQVLGCKSSDLIKNFPGFEEMTVSNYPKLLQSLDACRNALDGAAPEDLIPVPIAISVPAPPPNEPHDLGFHIHHRQR